MRAVRTPYTSEAGNVLKLDNVSASFPIPTAYLRPHTNIHSYSPLSTVWGQAPSILLIMSGDSSKRILTTVHGCQNSRCRNGLYMSGHSDPSFAGCSYSSPVTLRAARVRGGTLLPFASGMQGLRFVQPRAGGNLYFPFGNGLETR